MHSSLLTAMILQHEMYSDLYKRKRTQFTHLNLQLLDLENLEDQDCIDAINNSIFSNYFKYNDRLFFQSLKRELELKGGLYGTYGFH